MADFTVCISQPASFRLIQETESGMIGFCLLAFPSPRKSKMQAAVGAEGAAVRLSCEFGENMTVMTAFGE